MSDNPATDALGLQPEAPAGPTPPDEATVARSIAAHEAFVANNYNQHDPASVCYRRPDLEARYRAEADAAFNATMARHGARLPVPETPEVIAERNFNSQWSMTEMPKALVEELDARIVVAEAVPKAEQEKAIEAMQRQMGMALMERRGPASLPDTRQGRDAFVASAGAAEYAIMVRDAKIANPKLSAAALADKRTLEIYAAYGKYQAARDRAKRG
jgi:hypothetical protein